MDERRIYLHIPHPRIHARKAEGVITVAAQLPTKHANPIIRFNSKLALVAITAVGSMWCAYAFAVLAFLGLPTALKPNNIGLLFWIASDFLQLVLLSVIIVGQNIQAMASDKRAQQTYLDAEAVLAEAVKIQEHLAIQDEKIMAILSKMGAP
jgi:hypothetical protein